MNYLRKTIRSQPFLYKIFLSLKTGYKYKLPNSSTDIHITGYQRSGNTYTGNYLKSIFSDKKIVTHFHTISSIKSAFKNDVPVAVLIRNPENCILSSIIKRMEGMGLNFEKAVSYDLLDYINYYNYVLKHINKINLIHFNDAVNNESKVIKEVANLLKVENPDSLTILNALENTKAKMNDDKRTDGDRNMPSKYKEKRKDEIRAKVESNQHYLKCIEIYVELKKHCGNPSINE